jgi:hypothetical protein
LASAYRPTPLWLESAHRPPCRLAGTTAAIIKARAWRLPIRPTASRPARCRRVTGTRWHWTTRGGDADAFTRLDATPDRPTLFAPMFAAVGRRPG